MLHRHPAPVRCSVSSAVAPQLLRPQGGADFWSIINSGVTIPSSLRALSEAVLPSPFHSLRPPRPPCIKISISTHLTPPH